MKNPKILIIVRDGIVSAVYTEKDADVEVIDSDIQGLEEDDKDIISFCKENMYLYKSEVNIKDPKHIKQVFKAIEKHREKL